MPPKSSMNNKRNKSKKSVSQTVSPKSVDANSTSGLNSEVEDKFELELCWCIQQLEASLVSGKLQEKQAQDLSKQLHSLKSNTAPLIKKRQIMRNTLGDYRERMAEDERRLNRTVSAVKFANPANANKKSMFIRKAIQHDTQEFKKQASDDGMQDTKQIIIDNSNRTQIPFQFNFQTCQ